ncbi:MAG: RNA polymerase nonessential primary-like sigma factor [Myxococcota bacterium]
MDILEEKTLARKILSIDRQAHEDLSEIPLAVRILENRGLRTEQTRAAALGRLREAAKTCSQSDQAEIALAGRNAQGLLDQADQLRWQFAMSARRVAHSEARKLSCALMEAEDLRQHGYIGLLAAAERFDPERDIRFSTYARWWVRANITRALETTGRTVRLPGGAVEHLRNLRRARARMEKEGFSPDTATLAKEVGIDLRRARYLLAVGGPVSMDQEFNGSTIAEVLKADDELPPISMERSENLNLMQHLLNTDLTDRERFILNCHYGLNDLDPRSMAAIGSDIGLSRERVRQIELGALKRLRGLIHAA